MSAPKYYLGNIKSFDWQRDTDYVEGWRKMVFDSENNEFDVVVFRLPKKRSGELTLSIEKMLHCRLD